MQDVVLVTVDSLRADHVGVMGYERETTPFLDTLATDGVTFSRAFSHGQATRVSFPSILTSTSPLMYGGLDGIAPERTLIAEMLRDAGYQTAAFHSNLFLSSDFGYDRGFDTFFDSKSDPTMTSRLRQAVRQRLDQDGLLYRVLQWGFDRTERHTGVEVGSFYTTADDLTDRATAWLSSIDTNRPAFLWVHYMDVHHPYIPPVEHQQVFRDDPVSRRDAIRLRRKMLDTPEAITDEELDTLIDLYDAEIRQTDAAIRRLVEVATAILDDPVVIVTSDHGEEFREHGSFSHGTFHDEGVHVPLILADGRNEGQYDELVGLMDLGPTIADYARTAIPDTFHGHSLHSLLTDGEWFRTHVIGENGSFPDQFDVYLRNDEWKYIREADRARLYHLPSDPGEQTDVSTTHPDELAAIETRIENHIAEIEATETELQPVNLDESVQDRLTKLGYRME